MSALRRALVRPEFVVAVLLLGTAAVTLNFATGFLQLHFRKRPVPMRVAALDGPDGIPSVIGHWVQLSRDLPLDPDTEHILGTTQYIGSRAYVDTRALEPEAREALKTMTEDQREGLLQQVTRGNPAALLRVGFFYYTGLVDTVAHIPERCYIADGYDVVTSRTREGVKCGTYPDGRERVVSFRYINFEDQTGQRRESKNVGYLFHVNGHYESDVLGVRRSLQNLFERYGYYAKIELMTVGPSRGGDSVGGQAVQDQSLAAMEDFLRAALPDFERCMPDWEKLHRGTNK